MLLHLPAHDDSVGPGQWAAATGRQDGEAGGEGGPGALKCAFTVAGGVCTGVDEDGGDAGADGARRRRPSSLRRMRRVLGGAVDAHSSAVLNRVPNPFRIAALGNPPLGILSCYLSRPNLLVWMLSC